MEPHIINIMGPPLGFWGPFELALLARNSSSATLHNQFKISLLINRRHYFKLLVTYKFLNDFLYFPGGFVLIYRNSPNLRTSHSKQLLQPFAKCCSFYNSFFVHSVCGTHFLLTLFIVVASELLKVSLGLFTLFSCLCFSVGMSLSAILLLKSLILALGYGTDCTFIFMILVSFT